MSEATPQEPIMLKWYTCGGCGRPAPWALDGCIAVCSSVADKVADGMDPHDAARAHLAPGYALPETPGPAPPRPDCAWCGGECDQPRPFTNRRGEVFCSPGHRSSSNRALRRLIGRVEGTQAKR